MDHQVVEHGKERIQNFPVFSLDMSSVLNEELEHEGKEATAGRCLNPALFDRSDSELGLFNFELTEGVTEQFGQL